MAFKLRLKSSIKSLYNIKVLSIRYCIKITDFFCVLFQNENKKYLKESLKHIMHLNQLTFAFAIYYIR